MTALTWVDAAEAMLAGARELPETRGAWWRNDGGETTYDRAAVRSACALGAAYYAFGCTALDLSRPAEETAVESLDHVYFARFGRDIATHNDDLRLGRDYVLGNVKQLLDAHSAGEPRPRGRRRQTAAQRSRGAAAMIVVRHAGDRWGAGRGRPSTHCGTPQPTGDDLDGDAFDGFAPRPSRWWGDA